MANTENTATFTCDFTSKLFLSHFKDPSIKLSKKDSSTQLLAELLRLFVAEAAARAAQQVTSEDASVCEVEHVEKILPQLLLDF